MGSAFSVPLTDNGHSVNLVGSILDDAIIEKLDADCLHPGLQDPLSENVTPFTSDRLDEALAQTEMLVLAVNAMGIDWAAMMLDMILSMADVPAPLPLLFLTNGLEGRTDGNRWESKNERLQILPDTFIELLSPENQNRVRCVSIGGPSSAKELANRQQTNRVVAAAEQELAEKVAATIRTPYHHIWTSTDTIGVEVCAALTSLYGLACGLVVGLGEGDDVAIQRNTEQRKTDGQQSAAAIYAQSLWEIGYFVEHMGGQPQSVLTLPGAGDLHAACQGGSNQTMGRLLGRGMRYTEAKKEHMPIETIAGAELALAIGTAATRMVHDGKLDSQRIPLLMTVLDVVCNDQPVVIPWEAFFKG